MKKIKRNNINPDKLIMKSELARRQNCSPTDINRQIARGEFSVVVTSCGREIVHL